MIKRVSLILPVYNVAPYILKCLKSINDQTFKDFDLILVDDCSSDNSISIATSFLVETNIDYKIINNKENFGVAESRNIGIEAASAEYILFIDPDDWVEKTMVEELYAAAIAYDADIVACNGLEIWEDDGRTTKITTIEKGEYTSESYIKLIFNWEVTVVFWIRIFKRSLFIGISFPRGIVFEDFLVIPYLVEKANKIVQIESSLYNYTRRNDSISLSRPTSIPGVLEQMRKLDFYFNDKIDTLYTIKYNNSLLYFLIFNLVKFSDKYQKISADINAIKGYITLRNLLKLRVATTQKIWFFALLVKLNGRLGFFIFKSWQAYKK